MDGSGLRLPFNRAAGVVVRSVCEVEAGLSSLKHKQRRRIGKRGNRENVGEWVEQFQRLALLSILLSWTGRNYRVFEKETPFVGGRENGRGRNRFVCERYYVHESGKEVN